jgi:hypothetical protein
VAPSTASPSTEKIASRARSDVEQRAQIQGVERAVAFQKRSDLATSLEEELDVVGQHRDAKARQPALQGSQDLALAAKRQVDLGELEPVALAGDRRNPPPRELGLRVREEDALRLVAAPPDATAKLVELREAETLRALDQHHGRIRHVDANLDDRRGDKHVRLARGERGHCRRLFA